MIAQALEVLGAAVLVECAVQAFWHLGGRRFWRPDPPQCPELMRFKDTTSVRCEYHEYHRGPHLFHNAGFTYHRKNTEEDLTD